MAYPDDVLRLPLDEHRVVFLSGRFDSDVRTREQYNVIPTVSFCYIDDDWAAEWETRYGPISLYQRMDLPEGEKPVDRKTAKVGDPIRHHIWPCVRHSQGMWSQCAVDGNGLPQAFADGLWAQIFWTLQRFVESHIEEA